MLRLKENYEIIGHTDRLKVQVSTIYHRLLASTIDSSIEIQNDTDIISI